MNEVYLPLFETKNHVHTNHDDLITTGQTTQHHDQPTSWDFQNSG